MLATRLRRPTRLEWDAATGKLYGLSDTGPAGLYEIDIVGQTQTLRAGYPVGETDIDGLAVFNDIAYYITDGPNTTQQNFYVFNAVTGAQLGTIPSPFTGSGTFSAGTWVPEPSAMMLLAVVGFAALRRR